MKYEATVIPSGNATAVEIPADVMKSLGPEARPPITITINGHSWRSRVALMRGQRLVGISAANRTAAGIAEGDQVDVDLERDEAPRDVTEPAELVAALEQSPKARAAFDRLPFGRKRKHVASIEDAKSDEVRSKRIIRLIAAMTSDPS